jgi:outer membrane protein TolC
VAAARARAEQAAAAYAGAVLDALREVEDALVLSDSSFTSYQLTTERVAEARAADRLAKERYQRGVESLLTVLETERRLRLAEQAIITNTGTVWNTRINLFLALGGDWGTDPDPKQSELSTPSEPLPEDESSSTRVGSEIHNSEFIIPNSNEVS